MFYKLLFSAILFVLLFSAVPANAQPYLGLEYGRYTNLSNQDVRVSAARIINVVLGLLGIIVTVLIVYAGFKWMTAAGNEDAIKDARKIMFAAVIGLIIVLAAFAISTYVLRAVSGATGNL